MKLAKKAAKQPDSDYPTTFSATLNGNAVIEVVVEKTARGIVIRAEERVDGEVTGRIEASHEALQRALGLSQRLHHGTLP